jgi:glucokinase
VAAPVTADEIIFTNSPWRFSQRALASELGCALTVVNDFVAMARGAVAVQGADVVTIKEGARIASVPVAVLGPGTGLGLGIVVNVAGRISVIATQGGFTAFAPQDEREVKVLQHLQRSYGYVAFEHVLSGRGLMNLYGALANANSGHMLSPEEITAAALNDASSLARTATELFCAILGTFAGDAALMAGARGGVILAGGILPKIEPILRSSRFVERFTARDMMNDYMKAIPVSLLLTSDAALVGAALLAFEEPRSR